MLNKAEVAHLYFVTKPTKHLLDLFFPLLTLIVHRLLLYGGRISFSTPTSVHLRATVTLCASEESLKVHKCHVVPMFCFIPPVKQTLNQLHNAKPLH